MRRQLLPVGRSHQALSPKIVFKYNEVQGGPVVAWGGGNVFAQQARLNLLDRKARMHAAALLTFIQGAAPAAPKGAPAAPGATVPGGASTAFAEALAAAFAGQAGFAVDPASVATIAASTTAMGAPTTGEQASVPAATPAATLAGVQPTAGAEPTTVAFLSRAQSSVHRPALALVGQGQPEALPTPDGVAPGTTPPLSAEVDPAVLEKTSPCSEPHSAAVAATGSDMAAVMVSAAVQPPVAQEAAPATPVVTPVGAPVATTVATAADTSPTGLAGPLEGAAVTPGDMAAQMSTGRSAPDAHASATNPKQPSSADRMASELNVSAPPALVDDLAVPASAILASTEASGDPTSLEARAAPAAVTPAFNGPSSGPVAAAEAAQAPAASPPSAAAVAFTASSLSQAPVTGHADVPGAAAPLLGNAAPLAAELSAVAVTSLIGERVDAPRPATTPAAASPKTESAAPAATVANPVTAPQGSTGEQHTKTGQDGSEHASSAPLEPGDVVALDDAGAEAVFEPASGEIVASAAPAAEGRAAPVVRGAPETVANLAAQIARRLEGQNTRFEIALDPHGLGAVQVSVEINARGELTAHMAFEKSDTAAEMRGRAQELQRALEQAGFDLSKGGLSFDGGGGRERAADHGQGRRAHARAFQDALATADAADALPAQPLRWLDRARAGLDVRI